MTKDKIMKPAYHKIIGLCILFMMGMTNLPAQEMEMNEPDNRPVKNMFQSTFIFDNPSAMVPIKGTFEFDIQHRFGVVKNGYEDFWGLYAPSNIRLGFGYVPVKKLMVGFGITKTNLTWDFNARYAILEQTNSGSCPLNVTYYGNAAIDTREKIEFPDPTKVATADRFSYFHQLMIGRKFSDKLSMQLSGSVSHFNTVEAEKDPQNNVVDLYKNDHIAVGFGAKYNVTPSMNILVHLDQPLTTHEVFDPQANLSFGVEFNTSSHQFQFFAGNFNNIIPQRNQVFNNNNIGDGEFLLGFNIIRLWNF